MIKPGLPPKALFPGINAFTNYAFSRPWPQARRLVDIGFRFPPPLRGTATVKRTIRGVGCLELIPPSGTDGGTLLYLHGGGYCFGSSTAYRSFASRLADDLAMRTILPDYRLAPEHPAPAGLDDAVAVWESLVESGAEPSSIFVAGDSAGGGLALALALKLRELGHEQPAALGLICPWVDVRQETNEARAEAPNEPLISRELSRRCAEDYLSGGIAADDPLVSPILADLTGLAPMVIETGEWDYIREDGRALAARTREAGLLASHRDLEGAWHVPHLLAHLFSGPLGDCRSEFATELTLAAAAGSPVAAR